jgi:hypothetical protein
MKLSNMFVTKASSVVTAEIVVTTPSGSTGIVGGAFFSGEVLCGHTVVAMGQDGTLITANPYDEGHLGTVMGVVDSAYAAGARVLVIRYGAMVDTALSWIPERPVFLGANGRLTQTPLLDAKFIQQVGIAKTSSLLVINLLQPVRRAL